MSVDAELFHGTHILIAAVYDLVRTIPPGHVTTYGHIARLAGYPNRKCVLTDSRMVGAALKYVQDDSIPWHRVISSSGLISERGDGGAGAERQTEMLRSEGVEVTESTSFSRGKWRVSLQKYGWSTWLSNEYLPSA